MKLARELIAAAVAMAVVVAETAAATVVVAAEVTAAVAAAAVAVGTKGIAIDAPAGMTANQGGKRDGAPTIKGGRSLLAIELVPNNSKGKGELAPSAYSTFAFFAFLPTAYCRLLTAFSPALASASFADPRV